MSLTLYVDHPSAIHRLHPTTKLVAMICFFLAAFLTDRAPLLLPLTAFVAIVLVAVGALPNILRLRLLFGMVFGMTFVMWSVFLRRGTPWIEFGPLLITHEAVLFGAGMAVKLVTFLSIGLLFLSTTTIEQFAYALVRAGVPRKLGFTFTLAFRLVPAFVDSAQTVIQAQRSRGFDFERGGWRQRLKNYVPVIVPVFIGALRRADGMAMALEARGFQSTTPRTAFSVYSYGVRDGITLLVALSVATAYLYAWSAGLLAITIP